MLSILFIAQGLLVLTLIVRDGVSRRVEIASARNLFLIGFVDFQSFSAATAMTTGLFGVVPVRTPLPTGFLFFILSSVALAIFLRTWRKSKIAAKGSSGKVGFQGDRFTSANELHLLGLWPDLQICARLCAHLWSALCPVGHRHVCRMRVRSCHLAVESITVECEHVSCCSWRSSLWSSSHAVKIIYLIVDHSLRSCWLLVAALLAIARYKDPRHLIFTLKELFPWPDCFRPHDLVHRGKKRSNEKIPREFSRHSHQSIPSDISKSIISLCDHIACHRPDSMWIIENMGDRYPHDYRPVRSPAACHPIPRSVLSDEAFIRPRKMRVPKKPKNFTENGS